MSISPINLLGTTGQLYDSQNYKRPTNVSSKTVGMLQNGNLRESIKTVSSV